MLEAMLQITRSIAPMSPPCSHASATAMPVPAAIAQPQNADSLPEYSLMYMHTR